MPGVGRGDTDDGRHLHHGTDAAAVEHGTHGLLPSLVAQQGKAEQRPRRKLLEKQPDGNSRENAGPHGPLHRHPAQGQGKNHQGGQKSNPV